jgi:nitroreductase
MSAVSSNDLIQQLKWRIATKKFDANKKVSDGDWKILEEALILSPSSFGLQPYKFVVITDQTLKERLVAASWNQGQVADCSHMIVLAARLKTGSDDINAYVRRISEVRGIPESALEGYKQMMMGSLVGGPIEPIATEWAARQCYIALGQLMVSAAMLGIDACPMEGIIPAQYDEILGLKAQGFTAVVGCPVGYRDAEDGYGKMPKVRMPASVLIDHR